MENSYREINCGRITGMSSYELAVKHKVFEGTEEEYVQKEQQVYSEMVQYGEELKQEVGDPTGLGKIIPRLNDLGEIDSDSLDTVYMDYKENDKFQKTTDGKITYTCSCGTNLYFGMENETNGVQVRFGWINGIQIRTREESTWTDWASATISKGGVL